VRSAPTARAARAPRAVAALLARLEERGWTIAVAEADTGGVLLEWLTAQPGSSRVVLGGVVAYHDDLKRALLGVDPAVIVEHGAVSAETVHAMAEGMRRVSGADVALATTGIAGPGGATPTKPAGLAFVAVVTQDSVRVREHRWAGDRANNRRHNALAAIELALDVL
jgi:PncC family amidohydrolase